MKLVAGAILAVFYVAGAAVTYGAMNATNQYGCHHQWRTICDERMVRRDKGLQFIFAAIPPAWLSVILITAIYADGISFEATPHKID